jgi:hypothetical protein
VNKLKQIVDAPTDAGPTYGGCPDGTGRKHVEYEYGRLHYIGSERGSEFSRNTTSSFAELLYWIMRDITWELASDYEQCHRIEHRDSRRISFPHQTALMNRISERWAVRTADEHDTTLAAYPFADATDGTPGSPLIETLPT